MEKRPLPKEKIDEIREREKTIHPEAEVEVHPFTDEEGKAIIIRTEELDASDPPE